jgi:hypothetical protein
MKRANVAGMAGWKPQLGRITLFPVIPTGSDLGSALDLYKRIWKSDPDGYQKQPQGGLPFVPSVANGNEDGLSISCSVHPIRVDLSITPPLQQTTQFSLIEDTTLFHGALARIIHSVIETNTIAVNRAACFVQLARVARDYAEANAVIRSTIPEQYGSVKLTDEEDFILQINRKRQLDDIKMNFTTKWTVDRVQFLTLMPVQAQQQNYPTAQLLSENIVSTVTFDNSNVPAAVLSKDQLATILDEALDAVSKQQQDARLGLEGF